MSEDKPIDFDRAEKFSYAYVDGKYGKIAVTATGSAVLADPAAWSYAETHSYVKVDPSSVSVSVPSGVSELYAKVIYVQGGGNDGGGSSSGGITLNDVTNYLNSNNYVKSSYVDSAISSITIPSNISELNNDSNFITSSYVDSVVSSISIPVKVSELENDEEYVKKSYVDSLILDLSNSFNQKIAQVGSSNPDTIYEMGDHSNNINNLIINDRNDADALNAGIVYGNRI